MPCARRPETGHVPREREQGCRALTCLGQPHLPLGHQEQPPGLGAGVRFAVCSAGGYCSLQLLSSASIHLLTPGSDPAVVNASNVAKDQRPCPLAHHRDTAPERQHHTSPFEFGLKPWAGRQSHAQPRRSVVLHGLVTVSCNRGHLLTLTCLDKSSAPLWPGVCSKEREREEKACRPHLQPSWGAEWGSSCCKLAAWEML